MSRNATDRQGPDSDPRFEVALFEPVGARIHVDSGFFVLLLVLVLSVSGTRTRCCLFEYEYHFIEYEYERSQIAQLQKFDTRARSRR